MGVTRVRSQDVGDGAVGTADLADASVTFAKLLKPTPSGLKDGGSGSVALDVDTTNTFAYAGTVLGLKDKGVTLAKLADAAKPALSFRNRIINGGWRFWQRGNGGGGSLVDGTWIGDRWLCKRNTYNAAVTFGRNADVPFAGIPFSFRLDVTSGNGVFGSSAYFYIQQAIEGYQFAALKGRRVAISFWLKSNVGFTMSVALRNGGTNRSYVMDFNIVGDTAWRKYTGYLTHSETGTWDYTTGTGAYLSFSLAEAGGFFANSGAMNAWYAGNAITTQGNGQTFINTAGNALILTGVQVEAIDSAADYATDFECRPDVVELALCQRYYEKTYPIETAPGAGSSLGPMVLFATGSLAAGVAGGIAAAVGLGFKVEKRVTPTVVLYDYDGTANAVRVYPTDVKRVGVTVAGHTATGTIQFFSCTNAGTVAINAGNVASAHWTADAELT